MKRPFFGWYIVAAALVLTTYQSLIFVYGFTAFMSPIAATFGWTMAQVSFATSLRGLETGTMDPFLGILADRWPARRLVFIGVILLSLGILTVSHAGNLFMFYGGFLIVGLGTSLSVMLVPTTVIARWFKKNIGKANGILSMGFALGGLFVPVLTAAIDNWGWQTTLFYLSGGVLLLGLPISFMYRNSPQQYGLLPDGAKVAEDEKAALEGYQFVPKTAVRTRAFWFIGLATMFQMVSMLAVNIHMMPYLENLGFNRNVAASAIPILSIVTLTARIPFGTLADIFTKKYVMALSMGLTALGMLVYAMLDGDSFLMVIVFTVIYGLGAAGAMPLRAPIIREYFGVKRFGTIFAMAGIFTTLGSALGAPLAGYVFDVRGEYFPIWYVFAGLVACGALMIISIPRASAYQRAFAPAGMNI